MDLRNAVVIVTGGASGIGRALCRRFASEGARAVVVADLAPGREDVAREIGGLPVAADVGVEADVKRLVQTTLDAYGRVDLLCSNAGVSGRGGIGDSDADWQRTWQINVMAHVYGARAVLPSMLAAGRGYLLHTASAAGLLTQIGAAPYTVTKHAAVAFAEWLAVTYGDRGIRVSCLCPQGVRTPMLEGAPKRVLEMLAGTAITPEQVAESVVQGLDEERFLILPHPAVAEYVVRKATDPDRWLRRMRRWQRSLTE